ncbi:MAG: hypothetical protein WD757_02705 [Actinomycetota bacterium]
MGVYQDSEGQTVFLGHGSWLLTLDLETEHAAEIELEGVSTADVIRTSDGLLVLDARIRTAFYSWKNELLVVPSEDPARIIGRMALDKAGQISWQGDADAWAALPRIHNGYVWAQDGSWKTDVLLLRHDNPGEVEFLPQPLFPAPIGDSQVKTACLSDDKTALFAYFEWILVTDLMTKDTLRTITLPSILSDDAPLRVEESLGNVWFVTDTLLGFADLATGETKSIDVGKLREGDYIADFAPDPAFDSFAVALLRSGAVVLVNAETLSITGVFETGEQIGSLALLGDGRVVYQPWAKGRLVIARLDDRSRRAN